MRGEGGEARAFRGALVSLYLIHHHYTRHPYREVSRNNRRVARTVVHRCPADSGRTDTSKSTTKENNKAHCTPRRVGNTACVALKPAQSPGQRSRSTGVLLVAGLSNSSQPVPLLALPEIVRREREKKQVDCNDTPHDRPIAIITSSTTDRKYTHAVNRRGGTPRAKQNMVGAVRADDDTPHLRTKEPRIVRRE